MPMIATTIINSNRVNPAFFGVAVGAQALVVILQSSSKIKDQYSSYSPSITKISSREKAMS
jgi:hypothetical protein